MLGLTESGCSGCTIKDVVYDASTQAYTFDARVGAAQYLQVDQSLPGDFSISFDAKFSGSCGSTEHWWRGCGLVSVQAVAPSWQYIGCMKNGLGSGESYGQVSSVWGCRELCRAQGKTYFALDSIPGTQGTCGCSNTYGTKGNFVPLGSSSCGTTPIAGCTHERRSS